MVIHKKAVLLLILFLFLEQFDCRRGGSGGGRGSSGGRSGSSGSRGGGGFGRGSGSSRGSGISGGRPSGGGHPAGRQSGGGGLKNTHPSGRQPQYGHGHGFSETGIGSRSRTSQFKNILVGAAAGYLVYQGGKAIIQNIAGPMTFPRWGNRNYYWGTQYYPQHTPGRMCRMPIDPNEPDFSDVYLNDLSRPKEIVWSCDINESCCGYECCINSPGSGRGRSTSTELIWITIGLLIIIVLCCAGCILYKLYKDDAIGNNRDSSKHYTLGQQDTSGIATGHFTYPNSPPPVYGYPE